LKLRTRVVVLTMYGDDAFVLDALKSGAAGFLVKESCGTELLDAVHEVAAGRRYLSGELAGMVDKWNLDHPRVARVRKAAKSRRHTLASI
jgi:DNA-binding NarL/FixJ family response regulator